MFKLYTLSIDVLTKIRAGMNKIIISKKQNGKYPIKNALFNILSLAD